MIIEFTRGQVRTEFDAPAATSEADTSVRP